MKINFNSAIILLALFGASGPLHAQIPVPPPMPAYQPLSGDQLDQLLGPIALYPDPLIAQILPASTFPTEIVLADRYISGGGDPNTIDQQPWDSSIQALARYPDILQWMDQNLDWTTELGQAFLNQQQDMMLSIQRLRQSAYNLGNLQTGPQEQVIYENGYLEILPAQPQVVYVPVYQPNVVYYQSGFSVSFGVSYPLGIWLDCDFDWQNHHLIVWDRAHPRPANWWHERPAQRAAFMHRATVWRPEDRHARGEVHAGDRGWHNQAPQQPRVTTIGAPAAMPRPASTPRAPAAQRPAAVPNRTALAPAQHYQIDNPSANGAFIGIQSSQQTRNYSNRGRQSMQNVGHPPTTGHSEPVQHPAPTSNNGKGNSGNSGNGGTRSGPPQKH